MKKLTAKRPILYRGRMFSPGEQLPGDDAKMVDAWLKHGSAELVDPSGNAAVSVSVESESAPPVTDAGSESVQVPTDGSKAACGYIDAVQLEELKKAELERLAADMGVDISDAKTKADIIAAIAGTEVSAPAGAESENGGAQ